MAGSSITFARTSAKPDILNPTSIELLVSWVGDSSTGAVPTLLIDSFPLFWITKVQVNPGTAPTAAYDITFPDEDGIDLLDGALLDLSATVSASETLSCQIPASGFTFTLANSSAVSSTGTCKIFLNK